MIRAEVESLDTGVYRASIDLSRPGLWKVMLDLKDSKGNHFVTDDAWDHRADGMMERVKPVQ